MMLLVNSFGSSLLMARKMHHSQQMVPYQIYQNWFTIWRILSNIGKNLSLMYVRDIRRPWITFKKSGLVIYKSDVGIQKTNIGSIKAELWMWGFTLRIFYNFGAKLVYLPKLLRISIIVKFPRLSKGNCKFYAEIKMETHRKLLCWNFEVFPY